jgi:hypothetical protein
MAGTDGVVCRCVEKATAGCCLDPRARGHLIGDRLEITGAR